MFLHKHFSNTAALKCLVFGVLLFLLFATPAAFADLDCHHYVGEGWRVGAICSSNFNDNGEYVSSSCHVDQYEDPDSQSHGICKAGMDPGTCQGMTCTQAPNCTWTGSCTTSLDCCGMNVCGTNHRCGEPGGGVGSPGGGGGGGGGYDGNGSCYTDWDCDAGYHCGDAFMCEQDTFIN